MLQSTSVLDHYVHRLNATRNQQLLGHAHVKEAPLTGRRVAVTPARANILNDPKQMRKYGTLRRNTDLYGLGRKPYAR
jgi:hypothetical protein